MQPIKPRLTLIVSAAHALQFTGNPAIEHRIITEYIHTARRYPTHQVDIQLPNGKVMYKCNV